jgi:Amidohydrolase family
VHGARAWHAEASLGRIAPGMLADLAVWSNDLYGLEHDPAALLDEHAELTVVGGEIAYSAGGLADPAGGEARADPVASRGGRDDAHVHAH